MRNIVPVAALVLGLAIAVWIAYNFLVEMQEEAAGRNPLPAVIFSSLLIAWGAYRLAVRKRRDGPGGRDEKHQ